MNKLTTTVVITNYNGGKFAKSALDSIVRQTRQPEAVIVVDDVSTDNSVEIINEQLKHFKFSGDVRFFQRATNAGPGACRNTAIAEVKTDVIAYLDIDDFYYSKKLEKSLAVLENDPSMGVVYSDYDMWFTKENKTVREFKHPYDVRYLQQNCIVSCNSLLRRKIYDDVGLNREDLVAGDDYEMWLRMARKGHMMLHIAEPLFCYRQHGNNITLQRGQEIANEVEKFKKEMLRG